jgi:uncharacterized protein involved in exopolysaccharide biosynthesis
VALLLPPRFESQALLVPENNASTTLPNNLTSIANQFGLTLPSESGRSPEFYSDLVRSRVIVEDVLLARYAVRQNSGPAGPDSGTLLEVVDIRGRSPQERMEAGVDWLRMATVVDVRKTGIIDVKVRAPWPVLAAAIVNQYVSALNRFNTERRQSQARERRQFVEGRAASVDSELRTAEDNLRAFYEGNRQWQSAPKLMFEEGRLRRQLELRQELVLNLRRELESARIAQVNDTPVLTVIESGVPATRHVTPRRTYLVLGAVGVGLILVVFGVLLREYQVQVDAQQGSMTDLRANWQRFLLESRLKRVPPGHGPG